MKTMRSSSATSRRRQPEAATPLYPALPAEEEPFEHTAHVPRYQTFTVRFLVEPGGVCRRTEVSYVQEGTSDAWAGYDQARLAQWLADYVQPVAASEPTLGIKPTLRNLEVQAADAAGASHLIAAGRPLKARLVLDLTGAATSDALVAYTATVYARSLDGASWPLGVAYGRAPANAATVIEVAGRVTQPGTYRISAAITLGIADGEGERLSGGLIQVYEDTEAR